MEENNINTKFNEHFFAMKNEFKTYIVKEWSYSINGEEYKIYSKVEIVPNGFNICAQDINKDECGIWFEENDKYMTSLSALREFNKIIGDVLNCDEYYFCKDVTLVFDEKIRTLFDKYYAIVKMIIGSSCLTEEEIKRIEKID